MILLFSEFLFFINKIFGVRHGHISIKDLEHRLSEAVLQLWKVTNVGEFVELIKETFLNCSTGTYVYCFAKKEGGTLVDFSSGKNVDDVISNGNTSHCSNFSEVKSETSKDWLIENNYILQNEQVYLMHINNNEDKDAGLLFLICGSGFSIETSRFDKFLCHASACYTRISHSLSLQKHSTGTNITENLNKCADAISMQKTLNQYLSKETSSENCCYLHVSSDIKQIVCRVVDETILDFQVHHPIDGGLFSKVCSGAKTLYLNDPTPSEKSQLKLLFCADVNSALCVPIVDEASRKTRGIICLCNKAGDNGYSSLDVARVNNAMHECWSRLSTLISLQEEKRLREGSETMLTIVKNLFIHLDDVGMLLGEIIQEARNLTNAERCSVFLVHRDTEELVAKIFDGIVTAEESLDPRQYDFENMNEVRIPLTQGIAGHVATTGEILNIKDAYSHPLFYRGIDDATGFKTRNILCFPIKNHNGVVVGVSELCNKIKGPCFTSYDEELAEKFAIFSGISISHSLLYKAVEESGSRNSLANELVTYHMKVEDHDIDENIPTAELAIEELGPDFDRFLFLPRLVINDLRIKACILMYRDLGLMTAFHIPMRTLVHFLLMVRKGYRDPAYHNWDHAFSVMHHAYLLAKNLQLNKKLSNLEVISLLTASVCHDLDHRGTNNAFQIDSRSALANLYSSEGSVMERHHFAQAVCILSTAGCNIFENMKRKHFTSALDMIKQIILATDVATHLQLVPQLEEMAERGIDYNNPNDRSHLLALCMTASDLSDQTKDWNTTKETSKLIYKEFFCQGDLEKRMGNRPAIINDREKACVPQLQINFMVRVALPVYRILSALFPQYSEVHKRVEDNIERWRKVDEDFKCSNLPITDSLKFLFDDPTM